MPLPSFTVTGNLYDVLGNITGTDLAVTPTSAKVIFTPNIKGGWVKWDGDNHRILPVEAEVTADGVKRDGDPVTLLANDPGLSVENIQWEVLVRLNTVPGVAVPRASVPKPFPIEAPNDGGTVDLGAVAPVAWTAATPIIKGDKGDQGFSFAGLEPVEGGAAVQPLVEGEEGPEPVGDVVPIVVGWNAVLQKPAVVAAGGDAAEARAVIDAEQAGATKTTDQISDATTVGKAVVKAVDAAAARAVIDAASPAYVDAEITALIDGAPGTRDTLKEISDALTADEGALSALTGVVAEKYVKPGTGIPLADLNASDFNSGVKTATGGIVPIERFNPGAGFAAALTAAINEADASGGTVVLEAGKTYLADDGVTALDKHVRVNFNGATVVRSAAMANKPVLSVEYSNSTPQSVVAVTSTTYDWGGSSDTTPSTRIELASTTGWAAGDWAVIVGDDAIPGAITAEGQREGERVRVAAVVGNYLYLARLLRVTLTTAVRIARLTVKDCVLDAPWVEDETGSPATRNTPGISVQQAVKPRVTRARGRNLLTEAVRFTGCVAGTIDGGDMFNLRTSSIDAAYGYGFRLEGCNDFLITGVRGEFLRHLFTTTTRQSTTAGSTELFRFGSNIGHRVIAGNAGETGHAAFDTHDEAAYCVFDSCYVGWNHREPQGSFNAFKIRGRNNIVRDCTTYGAGAVELIANDDGGNHKVINHTHTIPPGNTGVNAVRVDYSARTARGNAELSGRVYATGYAGLLIYTNKATVRIPSLELVVDSAQNPFRIFHVVNSELIIDTLTLDLRGSTNDQRIFYLIDSTSAVRVGRLVVVSGGTSWRIADLSSLNGTVTVGTLITDTLPNVFHGGFINDGATATVSIGDVLHNNQSITDGVDTRTNADATLNSFAKSTQLLTAALTVARTITEPTYPVGGAGRRIRYVRTAASTGAFNWTIGDLVLTTGQWGERMWTGTAWATTSKGTL